MSPFAAMLKAIALDLSSRVYDATKEHRRAMGLLPGGAADDERDVGRWCDGATEASPLSAPGPDFHDTHARRRSGANVSLANAKCLVRAVASDHARSLLLSLIHI